MDSNKKPFYMYDLFDTKDMPIKTGPVERDWMDATDQHFAYRCLPLVIANQAGWMIHNPATFSLWWDGTQRLDGLQITFGDKPSSPWAFSVDSHSMPGASSAGDSRISSHFGSGVITFIIPFLFRTPPGVNLWVKGPTNYLKDGIQALEGVVETDWMPSTFTMNWKVTRPKQQIRFERGEPICMVIPIPRGLAENLDPIREPIAAAPDLLREYEEWMKSRSLFLRNLTKKDPEAVKQGWQKDYSKGVTPLGVRATDHQTRLNLREFRRVKVDDRVTS